MTKPPNHQVLRTGGSRCGLAVVRAQMRLPSVADLGLGNKPDLVNTKVYLVRLLTAVAVSSAGYSFVCSFSRLAHFRFRYEHPDGKLAGCSDRRHRRAGSGGIRARDATGRGPAEPSSEFNHQDEFLDEAGREFAKVPRQFLRSSGPRDQWILGQIAAIVPAGTPRIEFQVLRNARALRTGSLLFNDPAIVVMDAQ